MQGQPKTGKTKNIFTPLWNLIPKAGAEVWKSSLPRRDTHSRQRAALELLCAALWHLELAAMLGDFPRRSVTALRKGQERIPWEIWIEQRKALSVKLRKRQLIVRYAFFDSLGSDVRLLIQDMLIADAALRLDGVRDILGREHKDNRPFVTASREDIKGWLDPTTANFKDSVSEIQKQITIVVALRDSFVHGELADQTEDPLRKFRDRLSTRYSAVQIIKACREVWKEQVKLVTSPMA